MTNYQQHVKNESEILGKNLLEPNIKTKNRLHVVKSIDNEDDDSTSTAFKPNQLSVPLHRQRTNSHH